jgi:hypothetical protein
MSKPDNLWTRFVRIRGQWHAMQCNVEERSVKDRVRREGEIEEAVECIPNRLAAASLDMLYLLRSLRDVDHPNPEDAKRAADHLVWRFRDVEIEVDA